MKFWRIKWLILAILVVFVASCASTPEPEPEPEVVEVVEPEPEPEPEPVPVGPLPEVERQRALDLRMRIQERGIAESDPDNLAEGNQAFDSAESLLDQDNVVAKAEYESAILSYIKVLRSAFADEIEEEKQSIAKIRSEADAVRAARAAAEEYQAGIIAFNEAVELESDEDYDLAYDAYLESNRSFTEARDVATERRQAALDALERSRSSIQDTEERIRQREESVTAEVDEDDAAAEAERELADEIEEEEE